MEGQEVRRTDSDDVRRSSALDEVDIEVWREVGKVLGGRSRNESRGGEGGGSRPDWSEVLIARRRRTKSVE